MSEQERTDPDQPAEASPPPAAPAEPAPPAAPSEADAPATPEGARATGGDAPAAAAPRQEGARDAPGDGDRPEPRERRRRPYGRRKVCSFCVEKATSIDYKDVLKLRRYISDRARIEPRRKTGTCAKHQRWLALALKRARHLAMLPYSPEHIRLSGTFASRR